jgi:hypothetical protein
MDRPDCLDRAVIDADTESIDRVVSSVMDSSEDIYLYIYSNGDWRSLVGDTSSPTANKRLVARVSSSGELNWVVELADPAGVSVAALPSELETPHLAALPGGGVRLLVNGELFNIDSLGNVASHASPALNYPVWRIAVAGDGSTVLTGEFYLTRLDPSGVESWSVEFDATRQKTWTGRSIAFDAVGGIIVSGDGLNQSLDGRSWFLARYTLDGAQTWFNGYDVGDEQKFQEIGPNGITVDSSGNIIVAGRLWLESFTADPFGGDYDTVSKFDAGGTLVWYQKLWRVDGYKHMSVTGNSADDLVVVGSGNTGARLEYPNQFECSELEPCSRELRNARNDWAFLNSSGGGHDYFLVTLDTNGTEK